MIITSLLEIRSQPLFYLLNNFISNANVYVKLEGLNIAGSIKIKPAMHMLEALEKSGKIIPGTSTIICSSSGNLGIALSILCKQKHYPFICVTDPNILPISQRYIELYGGQVIKVTTRDHNGGYLASRIELINNMVKDNPHYVYVDQYENEENVLAHSLTTGKEIINQFDHVDYLFIGAGTTGTLMGCAKLFKQHSPKTKIIAVDAVGSVTFGFPAAKRYIPGLGTSSKPKIADTRYIDDIILVEEKDTLTMCHTVLKKWGLFLGGSSGTVLAGLQQYASISNQATVVTISPDFGDRYLNTVYNQEWIEEKYFSVLA